MVTPGNCPTALLSVSCHSRLRQNQGLAFCFVNQVGSNQPEDEEQVLSGEQVTSLKNSSHGGFDGPDREEVHGGWEMREVSEMVGGWEWIAHPRPYWGEFSVIAHQLFVFIFLPQRAMPGSW